MRSDLRLLPLSIMALAGAGCAPVDPGLGEALKYNQAIQTINPDPVYPATGAQPGDNGDVAAAAAKRYRSGNVKPVETMSASTSASGAGPK